MPLHHYLPATYLAEFSDAIIEPKRNSILAVWDLKEDRIFKQKASKIAAIRDLYLISGLPSEGEGLIASSVDDIWADYEKRLTGSFIDLLTGTINADTWLRVLVPFVACMLVRGEEFSARFISRINPDIKETFEKELSFDWEEQANLARQFEIQRLLAPILSAKWIIISIPTETELITNDIGYIPIVEKNNFNGIAIPLNKKKLLKIIPSRRRRILTFIGGDWYPIIEHDSLNLEVMNTVRHLIAETSTRFVFGANSKSFSGIEPRFYYPPKRPDVTDLGFFNSIDRRVHEFTWHRLVSILEKKPDQIKNFDTYFHKPDEGWYPPISFPNNLPMFVPGLKLSGEGISTNLYSVPRDEFNKVVGEITDQMLKETKTKKRKRRK